MTVERKELKDYTISEAMEICSRADDTCWLHSKNPDYPNADCMERCPFYEADRTGDGCKLMRGSEPVDWNVQRKPLGEYTINEWTRKCFQNATDCNKNCMFGPVCGELRIKEPAHWDI